MNNARKEQGGTEEPQARKIQVHTNAPFNQRRARQGQWLIEFRFGRAFTRFRSPKHVISVLISRKVTGKRNVFVIGVGLAQRWCVWKVFARKIKGELRGKEENAKFFLSRSKAPTGSPGNKMETDHINHSKRCMGRTLARKFSTIRRLQVLLVISSC